MAEYFFLDIEVIPCCVIRDKEGLALSSRNFLLTPSQKKKAYFLYKTLKENKPLNELFKNLEKKGFQVDYLEENFNRRFVAAHLGSVRLIDNISLKKEDLS